MGRHKDTGKRLDECESFIDVIEGIPTVDAVIDDCGHTLGYICKGWDVTPEQFAAGIWWNEGEDCPVDIDDIRDRLNRFIYRCIPKPPGDESAWFYTYEHSKPGRGAFKCSVYYLD